MRVQLWVEGRQGIAQMGDGRWLGVLVVIHVLVVDGQGMWRNDVVGGGGWDGAIQGWRLGTGSITLGGFVFGYSSELHDSPSEVIVSALLDGLKLDSVLLC